MAQLLLIHKDPTTLVSLESMLTVAGHTVETAHSGLQGLDLLESHAFDLVILDVHLPDISGLDLLRHVGPRHPAIPFVFVTACGRTRDAVAAMRLGAADFVEQPLRDDDLVRTVEAAMAGEHYDGARLSGSHRSDQVPHAAARWAQAVVPVITAPTDPRTIGAWSRQVFASPGALRNWCRMAGISPRHSLVFARLLRAVARSDGGQHRPENLLDVVDRRTLQGLLRLAGLTLKSDLAGDIESFLRRQVLVRDPDALLEIKRALAARPVHATLRAAASVRNKPSPLS